MTKIQNLLKFFTCVIMLCLSANLTTSAFAQTSEIVSLTKQGKYPEALKLANEQASKVKAKFGINHKEYVQALNDAAGIYRAMHHYKEAEKNYNNALKITRKLKPNDISQVDILYNLAALSQEHSADIDKVEGYLKQAKRIAEANKNQKAAMQVNLDMAGFYKRTSQYDKAEQFYSRVYDYHNSKNNKVSMGLILNRLAVISFLKGDDKSNEKYKLQALKNFESALKPDHPYIVISLQNLHNLYLFQQRVPDAKKIEARLKKLNTKVR